MRRFFLNLFPQSLLVLACAAPALFCNGGAFAMEADDPAQFNKRTLEKLKSDFRANPLIAGKISQSAAGRNFLNSPPAGKTGAAGGPANNPSAVNSPAEKAPTGVATPSFDPIGGQAGTGRNAENSRAQGAGTFAPPPQSLSAGAAVAGAGGAGADFSGAAGSSHSLSPPPGLISSSSAASAFLPPLPGSAAGGLSTDSSGGDGSAGRGPASVPVYDPQNAGAASTGDPANALLQQTAGTGADLSGTGVPVGVSGADHSDGAGDGGGGFPFSQIPLPGAADSSAAAGNPAGEAGRSPFSRGFRPPSRNKIPYKARVFYKKDCNAEGGACMKIPVLTNLKNVIYEYNKGRYAGQSIPRDNFDEEETASETTRTEEGDYSYADLSFSEDKPENSGARPEGSGENLMQQGRSSRSIASLPAPSSAAAPAPSKPAPASVSAFAPPPTAPAATKAPSMTGKALIQKASSAVSSAVKKQNRARGL